MSRTKKWLYVSIGGTATLALVFGTAFVFVQTGAAYPAVVGEYPVREKTLPGLDRHGMNPSHPPLGDYDEALADVLGVTVDELRSAYEEASRAAVQAALDAGLLTEDQAERFTHFDRSGRFGGRGFPGINGDWNAYLAEALEISVAELERAQDQARENLLAQALEDGDLTQEQVDLFQARNALLSYLPDSMAQAYENAVQQALADGAITQAQADLLLESRTPLGGADGFLGGRGMRPPHW